MFNLPRQVDDFFFFLFLCLFLISVAVNVSRYEPVVINCDCIDYSYGSYNPVDELVSQIEWKSNFALYFSLIVYFGVIPLICFYFAFFVSFEW